MSNRDKATDAKGEKQNKVTQEPRNEDEDLPPPYPGIPGADITSDIAPLCPRETGAHPHVNVTQPRAQPLVSQPESYPHTVPSAPPEQDSAPYIGHQKEPTPIPPKANVYYPQQYEDTRSYAPHEESHRGSQLQELYPIPPNSYPAADYPRQQYAAVPTSFYPTHAHVHTAPVSQAAPARHRDGCCGCTREECEDCAVCIMCTVAICDCLRCLIDCCACIAEISK